MVGATRCRANRRRYIIELENFASAPVMLTEIKAEKDDD